MAYMTGPELHMGQLWLYIVTARVHASHGLYHPHIHSYPEEDVIRLMKPK